MDDKRKKERQKVYQDKRWKTLRALKIQNNPLCEKCYEEGRITPAHDVHHIKSFCVRGISPEEKEKRAFDYNNLKSLCRDCHIKIHNPDGTIKDKLNKYDF